jgi:hypothetical protein
MFSFPRQRLVHGVLTPFEHVSAVGSNPFRQEGSPGPRPRNQPRDHHQLAGTSIPPQASDQSLNRSARSLSGFAHGVEITTVVKPGLTSRAFGHIQTERLQLPGRARERERA